MNWKKACKISIAKKALRWDSMGLCFVIDSDGHCVKNSKEHLDVYEPISTKDDKIVKAMLDWEQF